MALTDRAQLDRALGQEIERLELAICRIYRLLLGAFAIGAMVVYLSLDSRMAAWIALAAMILMVWFSLEERVRTKGSPPRWLRIANAMVESLIPWAFLVVIALSQSPAYALGSWVPPLLFAALIVGATARLRPLTPLLIASSGAVAFVALYFGLIHGMLTAAELDNPLLTPAMQVSRSVSLFCGGVLASFIARHLRAAMLQAHASVRERDLFGKYRLERRIGSGGMGAVYLATYCPEGGFERPVAVKQIHEHLASDQKLVNAFRHEAELSARLVHPNVVQVLDFGRIGERYFLALEYVEGVTLSQLLKKLRADDELMSLQVAAYITREVLSGLAYSHGVARDAQGERLRVVHRDLCPANILLSKNGEVKISDFGVARALKDAESANSTSIVGHVAYISPEQARALPVDERSDLFSLGTIVWEMLCNRSLFSRGAEAPTLMALVEDDVPPPSTQRGLLDTGWDHLVARALERELDQRARSARELLHMLDDIPDAHPRDDMVTELAALIQPLCEAAPADDDMLTTDLSGERKTQRVAP